MQVNETAARVRDGINKFLNHLYGIEMAGNIEHQTVVFTRNGRNPPPARPVFPTFGPIRRFFRFDDGRVASGTGQHDGRSRRSQRQFRRMSEFSSLKTDWADDLG